MSGEELVAATVLSWLKNTFEVKLICQIMGLLLEGLKASIFAFDPPNREIIAVSEDKLVIPTII